MGDAARFRAMADVVDRTWPDRGLRIADVAGGNGALRAELYRRGYRRVKVCDRRKGKTHREHYLYGQFSERYPERFHLVLGMHPDGATDQIIAYAARNRVPFAIAPCCVIPSAFEYDGKRDRCSWERHLVRLAEGLGFSVDVSRLPIWGANTLLIGKPTD